MAGQEFNDTNSMSGIPILAVQPRQPRAKFCHRLMPALELAAANGVIRNEPTTRRLLGYDTGNKGSSAFGHNLVEWAHRGLLEAQSTGERRFTYRLTLLGRESVKAGRPIIRKPIQPAVLLASYLEANPEEELGANDVVVKFGVTKRQAQRAIKRVVSLGLAVRVNVVRALSAGVAA